jgi:hypothetical protein
LSIARQDEPRPELTGRKRRGVEVSLLLVCVTLAMKRLTSTPITDVSLFGSPGRIRSAASSRRPWSPMNSSSWTTDRPMAGAGAAIVETPGGSGVGSCGRASRQIARQPRGKHHSCEFRRGRSRIGTSRTLQICFPLCFGSLIAVLHVRHRTG